MPKSPANCTPTFMTVRPPVFEMSQKIGADVSGGLDGGGGVIHLRLPNTCVGFFTPSVKVASIPSRTWAAPGKLPLSGGELTYRLTEPSGSFSPPWFAIIANLIWPKLNVHQ